MVTAGALEHECKGPWLEGRQNRCQQFGIHDGEELCGQGGPQEKKREKRAARYVDDKIKFVKNDIHLVARPERCDWF